MGQVEDFLFFVYLDLRKAGIELAFFIALGGTCRVSLEFYGCSFAYLCALSRVYRGAALCALDRAHRYAFLNHGI